MNRHTVIHYHTNIGKALKYAVRKELIRSNPMEKVDRPKAQKSAGQFYSLEEMEHGHPNMAADTFAIGAEVCITGERRFISPLIRMKVIVLIVFQLL